MEAIKLNDLAKRGPFGRSKLYAFVKDGSLPARKIGGTTFVVEEEWERFLRHAPLAVDARRKRASLAGDAARAQ